MGANVDRLRKVTSFAPSSVVQPTADLDKVAGMLRGVVNSLEAIHATNLGMSGDTASAILQSLREITDSMETAAEHVAETAVARDAAAAAGQTGIDDWGRVREVLNSMAALKGSSADTPEDEDAKEEGLAALEAQAEGLAETALRNLNSATMAAIRLLPGYQLPPSEGSRTVGGMGLAGGGAGGGGGSNQSPVGSSYGQNGTRPAGFNATPATMTGSRTYVPGSGIPSVGDANYESFREYGAELNREISNFTRDGGDFAQLRPNVNANPLVREIGGGIREIPKFNPEILGDYSPVQWESARPTSLAEFTRYQPQPYTGINVKTNISPLSPISLNSTPAASMTSFTSGAMEPKMGPHLSRIFSNSGAQMAGRPMSGAPRSAMSGRVAQARPARTPQASMRPMAGRGGASTMGARPASSAAARGTTAARGGAAGTARPMAGRPAMTPRAAMSGRAATGTARGAVAGSNAKGAAARGAAAKGSAAAGKAGATGSAATKPAATKGFNAGKATIAGNTAAGRGGAAGTSAARGATGAARPATGGQKGAGANMRSLTGARAMGAGMAGRGVKKNDQQKDDRELLGLAVDEVQDDSKIRFIVSGQRLDD